jgi:hypothetical protein
LFFKGAFLMPPALTFSNKTPVTFVLRETPTTFSSSPLMRILVEYEMARRGCFYDDGENDTSRLRRKSGLRPARFQLLAALFRFSSSTFFFPE